jgi:hypothetical protein
LLNIIMTFSYILYFQVMLEMFVRQSITKAGQSYVLKDRDFNSVYVCVVCLCLTEKSFPHYLVYRT